ncbi:MAG: desulfoferrodoxin [Acetobacterium sp.]|nr:desulfoferrodoxin [Bacillota bacterium]MCG2728972.1 desulfoferrodoxin [Acetobacterium sp.]
MDPKLFFQCDNCNSVLLELNGTLTQYCSHSQDLLHPNMIEASKEKHIPVLTFNGNKLHVKVGSLPHPMTTDHSILWIFVQTRNGGQYIQLTPENSPEAQFSVEQLDVTRVYAYCDIHGLWVVDNAELDYEEIVCSPEFPHGCIE